jgi:hypothetical protein
MEKQIHSLVASSIEYKSAVGLGFSDDMVKNITLQIKHKLTNILKDLELQTPEYIHLLKQQYYPEINNIKACISSIKDKQVASVRDKLYTKYFIMAKSDIVTKIFHEFIKGITLFNYENVASFNFKKEGVLYHREESCGSKFSSCTSNTANTKRNRQRILKCYLERSIYNELYKKYHTDFMNSTYVEFTSNQDKGHKIQLDKVYNDFNTCYKNTMIDVDIKMHQRYHLPKQLTIRYINTISKQPIYTEVYIRIVNDILMNNIITPVVYDDYVYVRQVHKKYGVRYKMQSYQNPQKRWSNDDDNIKNDFETFLEINELMDKNK